MTVAKLRDRLDIVKQDIIDTIHSRLSEGDKIEFEDLYLGEKSSLLNGYPQVYSIQKGKNETITVNTEDDWGANEKRGLEDYSITELLTLLEYIEEAL